MGAADYIGGAVGGSQGSVGGLGILVINYTSAPGNSLFLSIMPTGIGVSPTIDVLDSNGVNWTIVSASTGSVAYLLNSAAISFVQVVQRDTAGSNLVTSGVLAEYAGIDSVVGDTTNFASTSPYTVTRTLSSATHALIAGGGVNSTSSPTVTPNTGNLRGVGTVESDGGGDWYAAILVDNAGSLTETCSANYTNHTEFFAIGLEVSTVLFVTTQAVTSITSSSGTANGSITSTGASNPTVEGMVYSTTTFSPVNGTAPSTYGTVVSTSGSFSGGSFTESLTGLAIGTTYYVAAFAMDTVGYTYGNVVTFTTITYPTVTTEPVTNIVLGGTTAVGNGDITNLGFDVDCTAEGFVYDTAGHALPANGTAPSSSGYASNVSASGTFGLGDFSATLTGLVPTTRYYVRAFAQNTAGYSYGNEVYFSTLPTPFFTGLFW